MRWTKRINIAILMALVVIRKVSGDEDNSYFNVQIPPSLFKQDGYDHLTSRFGTHWLSHGGGSMTLRMYYANSMLCNESQIPSTSVTSIWQRPFALLVDRGSCTFVSKVRTAQRLGASSVMIADNTCLCRDVDCLSDFQDNFCETKEPILSDDGSGASVHIPSALLYKSDAYALKQTLLDGIPIVTEFSWGIPTTIQQSTSVTFEIWTLPADPFTRDFFLHFYAMAKLLGDRIIFKPHMMVFDGIKIGCQDNDGKNHCDTLCTNQGRYCAASRKNGISGSDIVQESLRRLCIWRVYNTNSVENMQFWDYVSGFIQKCDGSNQTFSDEVCIKRVYEAANITSDSIDECVRDSGGWEEDRINVVLEESLGSSESFGIVTTPTLVIFGIQQDPMSLTAENVFKAICEAFSDRGSEDSGIIPPTICKKCATWYNPLECVKEMDQTTSTSTPAVVTQQGEIVASERKTAAETAQPERSSCLFSPRAATVLTGAVLCTIASILL